MRLAIVTDWLPTYGGAEHVIGAFHRIWPDAPIFTTVARPQELGPLKDADIRVSGLQKWYRLVRRHQILLPWMPRAMESMDLRGFDVILSSSHAVGKGVVPPSGAVHICYCHTPMRYAWEMEEKYLDDFRLSGFLRRHARKQLKKLRRWDLSTAKRTDLFLANSTETQSRIEKIYGRESTVVPPPVEMKFFDERTAHSAQLSGKLHSSQLPASRSFAEASAARSFYLALGRLVPYKRFDLLIEVANEKNIPLVIAGQGDDEKRLRALAGPTVTFLGYVPESELPSLYASAKAVFFPQLEDAGVVPLEAQACGTPVIAFGEGGALDSVKDGVTGIFFSSQTKESVIDAIAAFEKQTFDRNVIREHARAFGADRFEEKMRNIIESAYARRA